MCRNAECLLTLIHLEEHRSAGRNFCSFATLKGDAFIIIVNTCETIELTFCFLALDNGERQAERCPDSASLHCAAIRCSLGCEWLVSHEVLIVVKNEIIRSKRFSRCSYLLIAILTYQLAEIAGFVVGIFVGCLAISIVFEASACTEHIFTRLYLARNKLIAGVDGFESRAVIEHKMHIRHIRSVETSEVERGESVTIPEHVPHIRHIRSVEASEIERGESFTIHEHFPHIRHIRSVEASEVERGESVTIPEHACHICHIPCIEISEVERREFLTSTEHDTHIRHILGVKILDALYCGQISAIPEPLITARWSCVSKRSIEDHFLDFIFMRKPPWVRCFQIKRISYFGLGKAASECKRSCTFVKLGILKYRSKITIRAAVGVGVVCLAVFIV